MRRENRIEREEVPVISQALVVRQENVLLLCLRFFLRLRLRPVIHIMSDVVAIAAFRELSHNASRMW